ncbi:MAG TPA: G1 family glutamic endopeptidase [Pseudonocardiaceae bacterium]|nr:G1 family glutamic endopeptidase [Pseudonocardiaceae bacterium]
MSRSLLGKALVAAAGLAALLGAVPAGAAPAHAPAHLPHLRHAGDFWGGYAIEHGGTKVTASWVNPSVRCGAGSDNSLWVGFDGADISNTVEQIGIDLDCSSGTVAYNPWYEMYPRDSVYFNEPTRAGDSMTATVVHDSGTKYTLTLADPTQNWSRTFNSSLSSAKDATAEVIMERLTDSLDNFGSMTFTGCDLDGKPFGNSSTIQYVLTDNSNTTQASTGTLNGDRFSMTWKHT